MAGNGEGENGENNASRRYWNRVEETRRIHESFIPKNKYGMPLPTSQRWGNIMMQEDLAAEGREEAAKLARMEAWLAEANFGPNDAAIKDHIRRLYALDQAAKRAQFTYEVADPAVGDFKVGRNRNNQGSFTGPKKLLRYTTAYWKKVDPSENGYAAALAAAPAAAPAAPVAGDTKKVGNKLFRWAVEPAWLQVDRKTNYDLDLGDTFARTNALGKPYLNARDHLWSIFYPDEPPIFRPARFRRRNTRRANRRRANRRKNNTRKY
jgi:hypothetical protein